MNKNTLIESYTSYLQLACHFSDFIEINNFNNIYYYGVGGSYLGGILVADILKIGLQYNNFSIIHRDGYEVDLSMNKKDLGILHTFSGNTHEIIEVSEGLLNKDTTLLLGVSSGGKLSEILSDEQILKIPSLNKTPRKNTLFISLLVIRQILLSKRLPDIKNIIKGCLKLLHYNPSIITSTDTNLIDGAGRIIVFYDDNYKSLAIRLKQQINENNKKFVMLHKIPSDNHNEINCRLYNQKEIVGIFIQGSKTHNHNLKRIQLLKKLLKSKQSRCVSINLEYMNNYFYEIVVGFFTIDRLSENLGILHTDIPFNEVTINDTFKKDLEKITQN